MFCAISVRFQLCPLDHWPHLIALQPLERLREVQLTQRFLVNVRAAACRRRLAPPILSACIQRESQRQALQKR
jgi:hypothetical protein